MKLIKLPIYIYNTEDECGNSSYLWLNPSSVESIFIYQFTDQNIFVKLVTKTGREHALDRFKSHKQAQKFLNKMLKLLGKEK